MTRFIPRRSFCGLLALTALGAAATASAAPLEQARILCGFPAGSTIDVVARRVADKLAAAGYAKSVLVDNRTGAGGQLAVSATKGQSADGSVILITPMSILGIYPHTYKKLPYDAATDLTPVSNGTSFDYGFAVGPAVPDSVKTIPEFMAWAKANPTKASVGSPAPGSTLHFSALMLGRSSGVELTHIGFRGSQAGIQDLLGGQLPAMSSPLGEFLRHAPGGKLRILGTSGAKRSRFTPNVPTYAEQGYKDMTYSEWYGFFLPAKASGETVNRLNAALRDALKAPDVVEALYGFGLEPNASSPTELGATLKADTDRWAPIVKSIGFTAD